MAVDANCFVPRCDGEATHRGVCQPHAQEACRALLVHELWPLGSEANAEDYAVPFGDEDELPSVADGPLPQEGPSCQSRPVQPFTLSDRLTRARSLEDKAWQAWQHDQAELTEAIRGLLG